MCIASATPGVIYAGVFIAACALYPAFPGNITWLSNSELYSPIVDAEMLNSWQIWQDLPSALQGRLYRLLLAILLEVCCSAKT